MRPGYQVTGVDVVEGYEEVKAEAGKPVNLNFKVTLASDSIVTDKNKDKFSKGRHDVYGSASKSGSFVIKSGADSDIIDVQYSPSMIREETIRLYVDGVASGVVTISPKVTTQAMKSVLNNWKDPDNNFSPAAVRDDFFAALQDMDGNQKSALQNALSGAQCRGSNCYYLAC